MHISLSLAILSVFFLSIHCFRYNNGEIDTVPKDVICNKIEKCDIHNVCVLICEKGSVEINLWAKQALALQRQFSYEKSICFTQLPGTHNSAITIVDGYGIEDHIFQNLLSYIPWMPSHLNVHTNDQLFSLTDQLRLGARLLEIDVHWVDNDLRIAHCGGFESPLLDQLINWLNKIAKRLGMEIEWDSETVGCKPSLSSIPAHSQRSLYDALNEISIWLDEPENKNEFLLIYFDDEINLLKWHKIELLLNYVKKTFSMNKILQPKDLKLNQPWPTFDSLVEMGKRVAFLSATNYSPFGDSILFHKNSICQWQEPEFPFKPYPKCQFHQGKSTLKNRGILYRPETSEIQYGILNAMGHIGPNLHVINEAMLPKLMECNVHIPSPDNLTPKRAEAMIWSFAPHEPSNRYDCIIMERNSSRWKSFPCQSKKSIGNLCGIEINHTTWTIISERCSYDTIVPSNGYENRIVYDLLKETNYHGVWISLQNNKKFKKIYDKNE